MINHVLFWSYTLVSSLGSANIIISLLLYSRYREKNLLRYSVILIFLNLLFLTEILEIYSATAGIQFFSPASRLNILCYVSILFILSILVPCFIIYFTDDNFTKKKILLISAPTIFYPINIMGFLTERTGLIITDFYDFTFFIIVCCWVIYLLKRKSYFTDNKRFLKVRLLVILILLFIPFLITDIIIPFHKQQEFYEFISIPFLFFYLFWSVMNLYFAFRLFFMPGDKSPLKNKLEDYAATKRMSGREIEVTSLIINGESNKSIAYILNISERTVKNHIYNIFRKTEAQSRIELFLKIYSHSQT